MLTWLRSQCPITRPDDPPFVRRSVVALFVLMHAIVFFNAVFHNPFVEPDSFGHVGYVRILSEGRLPGKDENHEFFCPPLPYMAAAAVKAALRLTGMDADRALRLGLRAGQLLQACCSMLLIVTLLRMCDAMRPGDRWLKPTALLTLAMMPVYYKTFAWVRGEPYVATFAVLTVYQMIRMIRLNRWGVCDAALMGLWLGLMALARQWGVFVAISVFFATVIWVWRARQPIKPVAVAMGIAVIVATLVSFWFYTSLKVREGSFLAFNREPFKQVRLSNHTPEFYTGLGLPDLFRDPVRPKFANEGPAMFYTSLWGDYWGYFLVYGKDTRTGQHVYGTPLLMEQLAQTPWPKDLATNRTSMGAYLGRTNAVSLPATLVLCAGIVVGLSAVPGWWRRRIGEPAPLVESLGAMVVVFTALGYVWFLLRTPIPKHNGDTVKAEYLMHVYPFIALLVGGLVDRVARRAPAAAWGVLIVLALTLAHNLPAMVTRFITLL